MYSSFSTNVYLLHITENVLEEANIKSIFKCNVSLRNGNRNTDFPGKYCNVCMSIIICNARLRVGVCKVDNSYKMIRAVFTWTGNECQLWLIDIVPLLKTYWLHSPSEQTLLFPSFMTLWPYTCWWLVLKAILLHYLVSIQPHPEFSSKVSTFAFLP